MTAEKSETKKHLIDMGAVLLCLFMVILTIYGTTIASESVKFQYGSVEKISSGWQLDGTPLDAETITVQPGETVALQNILPEAVAQGSCIMFYNDHLHVTVLLGENVLLDTGASDADVFGREIGKAWRYTLLPSDCGGQPVTLVLENNGQARTFGLDTIFLGTEPAIFSFVFMKNFQSAVVCFIALAFAFLLLAYYVFLGISTIKIPSRQFLWLGMFCLVSALWIFTDSDMMQFIAADSSLQYPVSYYAFMLIPLFFLMYYTENIQHYQKPLRVLQAVYLGVSVLLLTLYALNICHISRTLIVIHTMIAVIILALVLFTTLEAVKYREHRTVPILLALVVLALASIGNLIAFYQSATYDNSRGFRWGFLVFICILLVTSIRKSLQDYQALGIAQEMQKQNQLAQAKSDFFAKMSHDMRTPLNEIIGLSILAEECKENPPDTQRKLTQIHSSADYLLSIINDILDISKIENGKMQLKNRPFSMEQLCDRVQTIIAPQMKDACLKFRLEQDARLKHVYLGDDLRISQILVNLLSNAVKFTPEGGEVLLRIQLMERKGDTDSIKFAVQDTGKGMSKEFLKRIFQPFEQEDEYINGHFGGTGLGLSIVNSLVGMMQGRVHVESTPGKGSTFTVILPLTVTQEKPAMPESGDSKTAANRFPALSGFCVLLTEDNPINAEIARLLLEKQNMLVEQARTGLEAVNRFADSPVGYYSVILMDIRMPVMDGLEATRQIRALARPDAKTVPILAMSANAYEEDRRLSLEAGMNEHLSKPVDPQKLYETMTSLLRGTEISEGEKQ